MSIYTIIYADANDFTVYVDDAVLATARSASVGTGIASSTTHQIGEAFGTSSYRVAQGFVSFDTSAVAGTVASISLRLNLQISAFTPGGGSTVNGQTRTIEAARHNWTTGAAFARFRSASALGSLTVFGSGVATGSSVSTSFYTLSGLVSEFAAQSALKFVLYDRNQRTGGSAPTNAWFVTNAGEFGATTGPALIIITGTPWSFVGVGTNVVATATPLTLTEPAGVADGDLLIACIASRSTATTAVTNTGWTAVGSQNNNNTLTTGSAIGSGTMLYRIRSGTPDLTFDLPAGVSVAMGQIVAYRGSAQTTPLDVATAVTAAAGLTPSVTGLTTTQDDDLIVAMAAGGQEAAWSAFNNVTTPIGASGATDTTTAPSTTAWIERADNVTTTGADTSLGIFDAVRTGTGATGNLTVTASVSAGHVVIAGAFKIAPPPKSLSADAGSYAVAGTIATPKVARKTAADVGAYAISGTAATLVKSAAPKLLVADPGSYSISGATAGILHAWKATALTGSYSIGGTSAALMHRQTLPAVAGGYAIAGTPASFVRAWKAAAGPGAYAITGQAAAVRHGEGLFALGGAYSITGSAAALKAVRFVAAGASSYAVTGTDATLVKLGAGVRVAADSGAYSIVGAAAGLVATGTIDGALDVTEAADTLDATATIEIPAEVILPGPSAQFIPRRLKPIRARLDVTEAADTLEATALIELSAVTMDNDWLLLAA